MKTNSAAILALCIMSILFFSCEKEITTTPEELPPPTGFVSINSNPSGAEIYLNNRKTGRYTPDSLSWLGAGIYNIKLSLPLYRDTLFNVNISEAVKTNLFVDFHSNPLMYGSIMCLSKPDKAAIRLNGKPTNRITPDTLKNLLPGNYTLGFRAFGCREDSLTVTVKSSTTTLASVVLQDTTLWVNFDKSNSRLASDYLTCIAIDADNIKWIGTADQGLVTFDGLNWETYNPANSAMPSYRINCITINNFSSQKRIMIGTSDGLVIITGSQWKVYNTSNSPLPNNFVSSASVDQWGSILVGTMSGVACIPQYGSNWTIYNKTNSALPDSWISQVLTPVNFQAQLWVGLANAGIAYFYKNEWTLFTKEKSSLPGNLVSALALTQTSPPNVWAGFTPSLSDVGGLAVYENGKWTTIKDLPGNFIESIFLQYNTHWVCTTQGLVKFPTSGPRSVFNKSNSGLPSNHVKAISFDSQGNAWVAMASNGLVYCKMGSL